MSSEAPLPSDSTASRIQAIVSAFRDYCDEVPVEEIREAQQLREQIIPHLLQLVEDATTTVVTGEDLDDFAHMFATYLLAEFRAEEAFPVFQRILYLPDDSAHRLYGDAYCEDFHFVLANVVGDRLDELGAIIKNKYVYYFSRWEALCTLAALTQRGAMQKAEFESRLISCLEFAIENRDDIATAIVVTATDMGAKGVAPLIERAFEQKLCDSSLISMGQSLSILEAGGNSLNAEVQFGYELTDVLEHIEIYGGWELTASLLEDLPSESPNLSKPRKKQKSPKTKTVSEPKSEPQGHIGRNDPCPCGSGKKFKKCCRMMSNDSDL